MLMTCPTLRKRALPVLLFAVIAICSIAVSYAQESGEISGTVFDTEGRPLPSATIRLEKTTLGAISDSKGGFSIINVPQGAYTVVVTHVGFAASRIVVDLTQSNRQTLNVAMSTLQSGTRVTISARAHSGSAAGARIAEQEAPSVVNIFSAEEIARYPDPTTAEAMQRVPGVTITRVRGEAREVIVRGLAPRYNNTLIDGLKIPSPATNSRVVQLDYMPSELIQRIEVTKALTPDMEGDAIGGTVNLQLRTAPGEFITHARVGTGYTSPFLTNDFIRFRTDSIHDDPHRLYGSDHRTTFADFPMDVLRFHSTTAPPNFLGEITVGNRVLEDKVGFLIALDVQQKYHRSELVRNRTQIDADNNSILVNHQYAHYSHSKTHYGLNAKVDYIVDENNEIDLSLVGFWRQNREIRFLADTGLVGSSQIINSQRSVFQNHTIANAVLTGHHDFGRLNIQWRAAYADARQFKPDRAELILYRNIESRRPDSFVVGPLVLNGIIRDWQENTDRDLTGSFDLGWSGLSDMNLTLRFGTLFRSKSRGNEQNEYRLESRIDTLTGGNLPTFTSIDNLDLEVRNTGGTPSYGNNNYTCTEDVGAAYVMGEWLPVRKWRVIGGVRIERTEGTYKTFDINSVSQLSASTRYTDILPSIHFQYSLSDIEFLRFSVGQSISRPSFYDLVPYNTIIEDERMAGNPGLKRTLATNCDVRYEAYPGGDQQLSIAAFFKDIQGPIERTVDVSNPYIPVVSAQNLGNATAFGVELAGGLNLLDWLSAQANYTWTQSSITSDKVVFDRDAGKTLLVPETRPMQGQADHVITLALGVRAMTIGTFAQLSLVYTGRRLYQVSTYKDHNYYLEPYPVLDFSMEQRIVDRLNCFVYINNILDAAWEVRGESRNGQAGSLVESETYGVTGTIGLSYRF